MSDLTAFLAWYVAVSLAGLLALPLAFRLFERLPDHGYALARPLGLLTAGYVFWLLGSLGFLQNDAPGVLIAAGLGLAAGAAWLGRPGWRALADWLRAERAYVLGVEALFLLAFAGWTWVRAHNPEIVGTEKPMELMFINAILRSPAFPPNDAWLSGHAISYYYFGYVLMAALVNVTGVASAVAFNLGIALLFALTVTGSLGVAVNLMALWPAADQGQPAPEKSGGARRQSSGVQQAFWPALLAPLMVVLAGNFYGVVRLAHANGWFADLAVPAVYYDFGDQAVSRAPGLRAGLANVWTWLDLKGANAPPAPQPAGAAFVWDPGFWWWFNGARVTHDKNLVGVETEAITEMPAFSFILGDMHPHVLGLPFVFLALALGLTWLLWAAGLSAPLSPGSPGPASASAPERPSAGLGRWDFGFSIPPLMPHILLSALLLGGLAFLNTWDFPIYLFVVTAALALGLARAWGWEGLWPRWPALVGFAGALLTLGVGLYLPFYLSFQSQAGGLLPNLIYPTRFQQTAVMFAHTLLGALLVLAWLTRRDWRSLDRRAALWAGGGLVGLLALVVLALALAASFNPSLAGFVDSFLAPLSRAEAAGLMWQRRLVDSFTTLVPAVMVGLCVGLAAGALRRPISQPLPPNPPITQSSPVLFTLVLLLTGALLLVGPEFVYLRDNFGTRMNTIFKFYFQTWVLWGLAGAFGLWLLLRSARPWAARLAGAGMGLALAAGLLYTLPAVWSKADHFARPATLDGLAYFAEQYPADWAAIQWLQANVAGAPVIAEGIGGQYWIEGRFSRFSMATGLPTVMGWPGHESQWRGRYFDQVAEREGAIQQLYQVRDWSAALEVLDRYNIAYVIVTDLERQKYGAVYQPKFDQFMRQVYPPEGVASDVAIYRRLGGE